MPDISDLLFKKVAQKFPVMNVIKGKEGDEHKGTVVERVIANHNVTLVIGISNVTIIKVEEIEDE